MASNNATPLQAVETALQALHASNFTPGATPELPPMMSDTCVPWPWKSIGSGSGARGPLGHTSPTKSNPPITLAVGKSPSVVVFFTSFVSAP